MFWSPILWNTARQLRKVDNMQVKRSLIFSTIVANTRLYSTNDLAFRFRGHAWSSFFNRSQDSYGSVKCNCRTFGTSIAFSINFEVITISSLSIMKECMTRKEIEEQMIWE